MSHFGSNSLSKLPRVDNDIDVVSKQKKEVNIITQVPKEYKDVIKVFPKYRFETLDQDYWRRKSFIEGMPNEAFNHYSRNNFMDQQRRDNLKKLK